MRGHPAALVQELYAKMGYQALRPRVLVSYVREAYLYGPGNVRITLTPASAPACTAGGFRRERCLTSAPRTGPGT